MLERISGANVALETRSENIRSGHWDDVFEQKMNITNLYKKNITEAKIICGSKEPEGLAFLLKTLTLF